MRGRPLVILGLAVALLSCGGARSAAPPPPPPAVSAIAPPPPPPAAPAPLALERYQEILVRGFLRTNPARRVELTAANGEPSHGVQVLERVGRERTVVTLTAGFGRNARPFDGLGSDDRRVELFAVSEAAAPAIAAVLSAIGRALYDPAGAGKAWHSYESVALEGPISGLQYFDLLPGGEVELEPNAIVTLYRVVPLSQVEFEAHKEKRGDQWVGDDDMDPGGAARALKRWAPALGR